MSSIQFPEFPIPRSSYAAFDALTFKQLLIDRLNESKIFNDQNFEGSNINAWLDIVAFSYSTLLFYLNNQSAETTFSGAQLFENLNKIVSVLNYKPSGAQTSAAVVSLTAGPGVAPGTYTLPRYTFFNARSGTTYTLVTELPFEKTTNNEVEVISTNEIVLFEGAPTEHPVFTASGEEYEVVTVTNQTDDDDIVIADRTFTVFVKEEADETWREYNEVNSLYLSSPNDRVFEKRLNANKNYEFTFGNGVFGRRLRPNDNVLIMYVTSSGPAGQINANNLADARATYYRSPLFDEVQNDVSSSTTLPFNNLQELFINNEANSSEHVQVESANEIRKNAPSIINAQQRLVTKQDYSSHIKKQYNQFVKDVSVVDNKEMTDKYLSFFFNKVQTTDISKINKFTNNVVNFSTSCHFNNINCFVVPNTIDTIQNNKLTYVPNALKTLIVNNASNIKNIAHNIVIHDPIYVAVELGVDPCITEPITIVRNQSNKISKSELKRLVVETITTFFSNVTIGQKLNFQLLNNLILSIDGVQNVHTIVSSNGEKVDGVLCSTWYPEFMSIERSSLAQVLQLENFEYAFLWNRNNLNKYFTVIDE